MKTKLMLSSLVTDTQDERESVKVIATGGPFLIILGLTAMISSSGMTLTHTNINVPLYYGNMRSWERT